ncbi:hypothetical protein [Bordetella sp. LUAb4]|uniref:hypothetical protein n=1 Tax=Bordetella sp. LUAb4 TaxID=2843195 RepID=UPI001E3CF908|nr:hypothetical protein [Bordetella sp. LUAb4]
MNSRLRPTLLVLACGATLALATPQAQAFRGFAPTGLRPMAMPHGGFQGGFHGNAPNFHGVQNFQPHFQPGQVGNLGPRMQGAGPQNLPWGHGPVVNAPHGNPLAGGIDHNGQVQRGPGPVRQGGGPDPRNGGPNVHGNGPNQHGGNHDHNGNHGDGGDHHDDHHHDDHHDDHHHDDDHHHHDDYYYGYSSGWYVDPFAAGVVAGAATAAVIGSMVNTLPAQCTTVIVNGLTYQQCGPTWYQPVYVGPTVQYQVIVSPR